MRPILIAVLALAMTACSASKSFNNPDKRACITETTIASQAAAKRSFLCYDAMKTMRFATPQAAENYRLGCANTAEAGKNLEASTARLKSTLGVSFGVESLEKTKAEVDRLAIAPDAVNAAILSAQACAAKFE